MVFYWFIVWVIHPDGATNYIFSVWMILCVTLERRRIATWSLKKRTQVWIIKAAPVAGGDIKQFFIAIGILKWNKVEINLIQTNYEWFHGQCEKKELKHEHKITLKGSSRALKTEHNTRKLQNKTGNTVLKSNTS